MRSSAILLDKSSRFMILIRRVKPDRTYYVLPGGRLEEGESYQYAVIREVEEELGLVISHSMLKGKYPCQGGWVFLVQLTVDCHSLSILGEELDRSSGDNRYEPVWLSLEEAKAQPFFPEIDLEKIFESERQ